MKLCYKDEIQRIRERTLQTRPTRPLERMQNGAKGVCDSEDWGFSEETWTEIP